MPDERLGKAERLCSSSEFREVLNKGRAYGGRRLVLFCLEDAGGTTRVGFTTTRRVPNAVVRNRAKRLMREAYRRVRHGLRENGLRMVVLARGDTRGLTYDNVRGELVDLFTRARVWSEGKGETEG